MTVSLQRTLKDAGATAAAQITAPAINVLPTPVTVNVPPQPTTGKWSVTVHGIGGKPDQHMTIERTA